MTRNEGRLITLIKEREKHMKLKGDISGTRRPQNGRQMTKTGIEGDKKYERTSW